MNELQYATLPVRVAGWKPPRFLSRVCWLSEVCCCSTCRCFDRDGAQATADEWGFNCGPAALCAITGLMPSEIRPYLGRFEGCGYLSPTMMKGVLADLNLPWSDDQRTVPPYGLLRVHFDGPWCLPGVPIEARYKHTHWVAVDHDHIFDINAICDGGWLPFDEWSKYLIPWLILGTTPRANGKWYWTHRLAILPEEAERCGRNIREAMKRYPAAHAR